MGLFTNYYRQSKKEQDKILNDLVGISVYDIDTYKLQNYKNSSIKIDYTKDEADEILLKDYDKNSFFDELKRQIKPQVIDNMALALNGKSKKELEKERKVKIQKKLQDIKDQKVLEEEIEEEEKNGDVDNVALKSEMIKNVYINTAKEYYDLIIKLQESKNSSIDTGESIYGTRYDTKLIMYQVYMRKLDLWYRNINHGMPLLYDDKVKEALQEQEKNKNRNDRIADFKKEKNVEKIESINADLNNISEEMLKISKAEDNSFEDTKRLGQLKKMYADKKYQLMNISPSIGIMHEDIEQKAKMEEMENKEGIHLDDKYKAAALESNLNNSIKNNKNKDEKLNDDFSNLLHDDMAEKNLYKAEEALNEFYKAINEERYEDAVQSLSTAMQLTSLASDAVEITDTKDSIIESAKEQVEKIKESKRKEELNNALGIGSIYTDDEIALNTLKSSLCMQADKCKEDIEKYRNNNHEDRCR